MYITNEQWNIVEPLIPKHRCSFDGRGRPRRNDREVLEGILWILKTGARWKDLPREYPPHQTCHRRLQEWVRRGVIHGILTAIAQDMELRGKIDLSECFIDGTFASAKKGARVWDLQSAEKAQRSWIFRTRALFLSPSVWPLLLRVKSPWWKQRLPHDLPERIQIASLVIGPLTPIPSMRN